MAVDELLQRVGEAVSRRKFLARTGAVFLGAAYTILGLPRPAAATCSAKCCVLCYCPSSNCCGQQIPWCIWSWTCCYRGTKYRCSEYYCGSGDCDAGCGGVNCSKITAIGPC